MTDILDRLRASLADRYTVERELGQGGMATVFLATDVRHEREVAIKVLNPELAATIGGDRFEREIKLAAKLQHPNILGLYDSGNANGLLFYVMPFVRGESLRDRLEREGQLPVEDAVQLALEVADALGYAHAQGIVHRDIKPENILLSNGHALVADFGIARAATEGGAKLTQTGVSLGTPSYMSPEQASGEPVGPSSDIYSLGCVLYEMLAGDPPFTGKNSMAIMARHAMDTLPSVRIVRPAVPEEVEEAIFAAMEKAPADRPRSAADFAAIMGVPLGATASRRVNTPRATGTRRIPTGMQTLAAPAVPWWRRTNVVMAAVVLAAVVTFGVWKLSTAGARPGARGVGADSLARRVAVLYFADNSKNGELRPVADGLTEALIRSLSDVSMLHVVSRNGVARYRDSEAKKDSIARALHAGTLIAGSVEPDGKSIRVSTILYDGNGTDLGKRGSVVVPRDSLFRAADAVAAEVSRNLRAALGEEVRLKEGQAGTQSLKAWTLLSQAEQLRKDAERAALEDRARAGALLAQADSVLQQSEQEDNTWIDPVLLQGELTYQRGRLETDKAAASRWFDAAQKLAARALDMDPFNARALALRGTALFMQWRLRLTTDPVARATQLEQAVTDLENAVKKDPSLATAYAMLSNVYYDKKDVPTSFARARQAYEADAFLSNTNLILSRLFWTSYDTQQFGEAAKWCDEGARRFPGEYIFALCKLWMGITPDALPPDIPEAWRLAARVDSLAPPNVRPMQSHIAQLVVGGMIGRAAKAAQPGPARAALMDSANKVLLRARGDRTVDPSQELPGYEAIMRTQMGDYATAVSLLKQYVAVNPDHSFRVGANVHWWWQDLLKQPGFEALLARQR